MIETFREYDVYTRERYHDLCMQKIYREKYVTAESARDFQKLLFTKEYIFLKQSVHRRLRILTGAIFYPLLELYHRVKTKK